MAWIELLKREECKKAMDEARAKSMTKDCTVYVQYNARNDYFYVSDYSNDGTVTNFRNGERFL